MPSLQDNDFALFGLPEQFAQDRSVMDARWKELQREAHPDKFVVQGAAAQRLAMQWSVRINEAYQRLKDPLRRASYLCELRGAPIQAETNTAMPTEFLMQQMQWREDLDDARSAEDIEKILLQGRLNRGMVLQKCEHLLDETQDYAAAAQQVRVLMFITRFMDDAHARLDAL